MPKYEVQVQAPGANEAGRAMGSIGAEAEKSKAKLTGMSAAMEELGKRAGVSLRKGETAAHLMGRALGGVALTVAGGAIMAGLAKAKGLWDDIASAIEDASTAAEKHGATVSGIGDRVRLIGETWLGIKDDMKLLIAAPKLADIETERQKAEKEAEQKRKLEQDRADRRAPGGRWGAQLQRRFTVAERSGDTAEMEVLRKLGRGGEAAVASWGFGDAAEGERVLRARWSRKDKAFDEAAKRNKERIDREEDARIKREKDAYEAESLRIRQREQNLTDFADRFAAATMTEYELFVRAQEKELAAFIGTQEEKTALLKAQTAERGKLVRAQADEEARLHFDLERQRKAEEREDLQRVREAMPNLRRRGLEYGVAGRENRAQRRAERRYQRDTRRLERRAADAQRRVDAGQPITAQGQAALDWFNARKLVGDEPPVDPMKATNALIERLIEATEKIGFRG